MTSPNASSPAPGGGGARVFEGGEGAFASTSKSGGSDNQPPRTQSSLWSLLDTDLGWFGLARTPKPAEKIIEDSGLPADHRALIARVVKRTKLWRRERADVARELVAHFADGLAASAGAEDLINSFGDEKQAAKLIRRAKKRNRGIVWQAWNRAGQAVSCVALLIAAAYLYFGLRVWTASPSIQHDYLAELNAPALAVPEQDRAWPLIRDSVMELGPPPMVAYDESGRLWDIDIREESPGTTYWEEVVDYLRANRRAIDLALAAARKPSLGFVGGRDDDASLLIRLGAEPTETLSAPLSQLQELSDSDIGYLWPAYRLAVLLGADARLAASEGRSESVTTDLRAAIRIAELSFEAKILDMHGNARVAFVVAWHSTNQILETMPNSITSEDLQSLAHVIASIDNERLRPNLHDFRPLFNETMQRLYSDDGRGNGVVVFSPSLMARAPGPVFRCVGHRAGQIALAPLLAAVITDRRSQTAFFENLVSRADRIYQLPLWQHPPRKELADVGEFHDPSGMFGPSNVRRFHGMIAFIRHLPVYNLMSWSMPDGNTDHVIQVRDATLVAIALELFRRREGVYPASLSELTPSLLPVVPSDRHTGKLLNYTLQNGQPILYSVGIDLDDDCGVAPPSNLGRNDAPHSVSDWLHPVDLEQVRRDRPASIPDGDWILYPPSRTR